MHTKLIISGVIRFVAMLILIVGMFVSVFYLGAGAQALIEVQTLNETKLLIFIMLCLSYIGMMNLYLIAMKWYNDWVDREIWPIIKGIRDGEIRDN